PTAIAEARRQAAERLKVRCRQLLEHPEQFRFDTNKVARLARQYPEVLRPGWRAIVQSPQHSFVRRLVAASFLCDQRDDAGLDFLLGALQEGTAADRGQALSEINRLLHFEATWLGRRGEELYPLLLRQLDERLGTEQLNLIPQAAWACKWLK